jgi:thiamine kinase-like enzyme
MNIDAIKTWKDWEISFQDIETFLPLIREIFDKHKLTMGPVKNTFAGTNAVFQVGQYIVKIFVPTRVKPWDQDDYAIELLSLKTMNTLANNTPKLYAYGKILKKLEWSYLVMEYKNGHLMKDLRGSLEMKQKKAIVKQLKNFLSVYHTKVECLLDKNKIQEDRRKDNRWAFLKESIREELYDLISLIDSNACVRVHGDLTGDNLIFDGKDIIVLDFADTGYWPPYYEYAPIVLDLFYYDQDLISLFFDSDSLSTTIDLVVKSILIHDFGGDIAKDLLKNPKEISSLQDLKERLKKEIQDRICSSFGSNNSSI